MLETEIKELNANLKALTGLVASLIKGTAPSRETGPDLVSITSEKAPETAPTETAPTAPEVPVNTEEKAKKTPKKTVKKEPLEVKNEAPKAEDSSAVRKAEQAEPAQNAPEEMPFAQFQKEMFPWLDCAADIANYGGAPVYEQIEALIKPLGVKTLKDVKPGQRHEVLCLANEGLNERKAELAHLMKLADEELEKNVRS